MSRGRTGLVGFTIIVGLLGLAMLAVVVGYVFKRSANGISVSPELRVDRGNALNGPALLQQYGCVTCHEVAGVARADGVVGPPLSGIAGRAVIAGRLRNRPENLVHWIRFPQQVDPGNAMPDLNVHEEHARDIAAYLYSLE